MLACLGSGFPACWPSRFTWSSPVSLPSRFEFRGRVAFSHFHTVTEPPSVSRSASRHIDESHSPPRSSLTLSAKPEPLQRTPQGPRTGLVRLMCLFGWSQSASDNRRSWRTMRGVFNPRDLSRIPGIEPRNRHRLAAYTYDYLRRRESNPLTILAPLPGIIRTANRLCSR